MDVDTNIDNYMISELFDILDLDENTATTINVIDATNEYINEIENNSSITETRKDAMVEFFEAIRDNLVFFIENDRDDDDKAEPIDLVGQNISEKNIVSNWEDSHIWESTGDGVVLDKGHNEMKDKIVDVPNMRTTSIFKGLLNPSMKDTVTRIINVDSQYRQFVAANEYKNSCDFTIDLSEPLVNVLSIRCYSVQIPYSWYVFDEETSTNFFWIDDTKITIESGNYFTIADLVIEINEKITAAGINDVSFTSIKQSGKVKFTQSITRTITFYDVSRAVEQKKNTTMGWIMGFRTDEYSGQVLTEVTGEALADLYGTKYVYIYLDEFSSNRVNNSIVNMSDMPNEMSRHMSAIPRDLDMMTNADGAIVVRQENPRRNTNNQRFAMNRIFEAQSNKTSYPYSTAPATTNILTLIPIKKNGFPVGEAIIEFGGSLQSSERVYFGPVNITRMRVKLLDDKGRVMNLNGNDWSFSFLCDTLYKRTDLNDGASDEFKNMSGASAGAGTTGTSRMI
jgi:hypothetical protein